MRGSRCDVQRLLGRHRADPHERAPQPSDHGAVLPALPSRPTTARNTSSSDGSAALDRHAARARARGAPRATSSASSAPGSTRTCSPAPNGATPRTPSRPRERAARRGELLRRAPRARGPGTHVRLSAAGVSSATSRPSTMRPMRAAVLRLVEVVRRHEDGRAVARELADEAPERAARDRVHAGGRLVEEDDLGPVQERAGEREPLADAAGERARASRRRARVRPVARRAARRRGRASALPASPYAPPKKSEVLAHGQVQVERELLGHVADGGLHRLGLARRRRVPRPSPRPRWARGGR